MLDNHETQHRVKRQDRGASAQAIQHHYDVGNDFYGLWLDPTMTYSCGLWRDEDETLHQAQVNKLDWVGDQVRAGQAKSVLEVGCGWGGLSRRLATNHEVVKIVGLTLSLTQQTYARAEAHRLGISGIEVRLEAWAEHVPAERYDAVVSIEAFEAFARPELTDAERVRQYRGFFEMVADCVVPRGKLILQTISYGSVADRPEGKVFFQEVFPETDCPRLTEMLLAAHGLFELQTLRNDREDYVKTCNLWLRNLKAHSREAEDVVGAETVEFYKKYLAMSAVGFKIHSRTLDRMVFARLA